MINFQIKFEIKNEKIGNEKFQICFFYYYIICRIECIECGRYNRENSYNYNYSLDTTTEEVSHEVSNTSPQPKVRGRRKKSSNPTSSSSAILLYALRLYDYEYGI